MSNKGKKVYVAMSGGVDSSVAAALLKEKGYDVEGITMCFHILISHSKKPSCCGTEGIQDARRVAKQLDIPHHVVDFAGDIDNFIIKNFVQEYVSGRTPNPCVRCNQFLKFDVLYKMVKADQADYLATGHYARNVFDSDQKTYALKLAKDFQKDQCYFLYGIKKDVLPHLLFPLGDLCKNQVRELARKYQLDVAQKSESQDICFVPPEGYKYFLKERLGEKAFIQGPFLNANGEVVGQHKGIMNYTIGQRDKLGLALGYPVYVYKIDPEKNSVYVGEKKYLLAKGLFARQCNFVSCEIPKGPLDVGVRIRYNAPVYDAVLSDEGNDMVRVDFKSPQAAVTPGQSVVFYQDDIVLGGAIIEEAICE